MKTKLTFLFTFSIQLLFAQKTQVTEVTESIGGGSNPGYSVYLENVDPKGAEKEWIGILKGRKGKSVSSKELKDQVIYENVNMAAVGTEPLKVYSKIVKDKNAIRITAAFAKPGGFISSSSDPGADMVIKKLMYYFGVNFKKKMVAEVLEEAKSIQKKNQEKQKSLERTIESNRKDIISYQNKINGDLQQITKDSIAVEDLKILIQKQNETLENITQKLKDVD